jgi:hypothetical protein
MQNQYQSQQEANRMRMRQEAEERRLVQEKLDKEDFIN